MPLEPRGPHARDDVSPGEVIDEATERVIETAAALDEEIRHWAAVGLELKLRRRRRKD